MANILALVELTHTGHLAASARGLLAVAARLGTPVAVTASETALGPAAAAQLAEIGRAHV